MLHLLAATQAAPAGTGLTTWIPVLAALIGGGTIMGIFKVKPERQSLERAASLAAVQAVNQSAQALRADLQEAREELLAAREDFASRAEADGLSLTHARVELEAAREEIDRLVGVVTAQRLRHDQDTAEIAWLRRRVSGLERDERSS